MNLVRSVVRSGEHDSLKMNVTVMRLVPLLILGNLNGNEVTTGRLHSSAISSQRPSTLLNDYVPFPEVGIAYKFVKKDLTWHDARRHCISEGSNLAVFDSRQKLDIAIISGSSYSYDAWSGVHNLFSSNEWINVKDGVRVTFFSWHTGYPMNFEAHPCLAIYYDGGRKMTHYNSVCSKLHYFFCETPLEKNHTPLV